MKTKKWLSLLLTAVLSGTALAACGTQGTSESGGDSSSASGEVSTPNAVVLYDFEDYATDVEPLVLLNYFGKADRNSDKAYVHGGEYSLRMVPEGCPSENSALAPTLKFPLDLQKKGVDAADVSQTTRISAQIYNAADEEVTMQTQLQFFGGDTANAQSHTLAPGWNTVLISVDAQSLGLSYGIFACKGLLFAFGLSEEAPTLYMDDIILYRTETPYTPMEITLDEYEICSFDKLYQQYVIVPYNRFENYIPEVSLNTDVAYARNGRSLRVMMPGNDGSFQTGNSSSYSYTGFSLSAGFMEEVHMEQYPEEDDEYTYNFSFWVYNAGSSQQRLFIHFYNADGDVYKSVTDIYVPAGEWEEVSIPLSELTAGTSNTSYRNSGEIYINWEINTLLEDRVMYYDEFYVTRTPKSGGDTQA